MEEVMPEDSQQDPPQKDRPLAAHFFPDMTVLGDEYAFVREIEESNHHDVRINPSLQGSAYSGGSEEESPRKILATKDHTTLDY